MNDFHKPVLIVIAGPNGSGKTSVTSKILHHEWMEDSIYINPDIVAQERFGDWNSKDAVIKAVKFCEELRETCLTERKSLIYSLIVQYLRQLMPHVLLAVSWKEDMMFLFQKLFQGIKNRYLIVV